MHLELRHSLSVGLYFQVLLQDADEVPDLHGLGVPQVEHSQLWLVFPPPTAANTGLRSVKSSEAPLDNVINVSEIPCKLLRFRSLEDSDGLQQGTKASLISDLNQQSYRQLHHVEDLPHLSFHNVVREGEVGHVRSAPRAVDGEEPQCCYGQAVDVVVRVAQHLVSFLNTEQQTQSVNRITEQSGYAQEHNILRDRQYTSNPLPALPQRGHAAHLCCSVQAGGPVRPVLL